MVLESLIPANIAEQKPIKIFPIAFTYATIAIFISYWLFPTEASMTFVFFTVMACLPLMLGVIGLEKIKAESFIKEVIFDYFSSSKKEHTSNPFIAHKQFFLFITFLTLGLIAAFTLWYVVLPTKAVNIIFDSQIATINMINSNVNHLTGNAINVLSYFGIILTNNLKVLMFCLLFSFIYGAGAIFILTWNASVVSIAIGNSIRSLLSKYAAATGAITLSNYFSAFSLGLLRYLTHGIPEIIAYFIGGLAGGIISMAVIKHDFMDSKFKLLLMDSLFLVLISVALLILAGLLETFVSPFIPVG